MNNRESWWRKMTRWPAIGFLALWAVSLFGAALAGAYAYRGRNQIRALISSVQGSPIVETNLYNLMVRKLSVDAQGRDGGIAALGDGILFSNRLGTVWYVDPDLALTELALTVPVNVDDFEADPFNVDTNFRDRFGVKDLHVQPLGTGVRLMASYNYWYEDRDCYSLRVSSIETTPDAIMSGGASLQGEWRTIYETEPCSDLTANPNGVNRNPTLGAGGRIAPLSDDEILVTVGGFGPEAVSDGAAASQSYANPFGKTILIDLGTGGSEIFTIGHRNPQGLAVGLDGEVWLTEHAARGGDELNRLVEGRNYGYPVVSYGTEYERMEWRSNPRQGHHEGFERPTYSWVPSIGSSQAWVMRGTMFDRWEGDVMVSSLAGRTLHRVHIEGGQVAFVEPITIGHRIRDITQAKDGTIVLKTEDDFLVYVQPVDAQNMNFDELEPEVRGQLLATACTACHAVASDASDGIGPNLWGIVGREVAALDGFAYSEALRGLGGDWSADRLEDFIRDPNAVVPGTSMVLASEYTDRDVSDILAYLRTLQ